MGIEQTNDKPLVSQHIKEKVDSGFSGGRKLYGDLFNVWSRLRMFTYPEKIQTLQPLPHYRQYMAEAKSSGGESRYPQAEIDYVMRLSDPISVAHFDQLIDEFNSKIEGIKQINDVAGIQTFIDRANTLVYKKSDAEECVE
ncbi:MAG: hypothetical protein UT32_C0019G0011 [Parcubacteria group bacterium GW2011_GWC2_39_14]|nr:MAG: hypothetical protein UT32_C0019G0011 [Parcubacteria group bacterium GW2011_GWC2_39_14]KKR54544.1 MAG: hypothetical protein UT91_C0013G0011 [Parcubacteria group bacterium GW2011_GWA2_40_23]